MQIIREIPAQLHHAWSGVTAIADNVRERISAIAVSAFDSCVPDSIKPWFERNIQPLNATDYLVLIIGLEVSLLLLGYGWLRYGNAALPLGLCAAGMIMGGCGIFCRKRVQRHFDEKAWEQIDLMRRAAHDITVTNQDFSALAKARAVLEKPEFSHLQEDLKRIDEETRRLKADVSSPNYEVKQDIVKAHLTILAPKVQANAQDKAIIEDLTQEINK